MAWLKKTNVFPWRKKSEYLSNMSEKGLHIQKIGVFKNTFEKDEGKRYIYISVQKSKENTLPSNWELLTERKKVCYYRKKVSAGCVCEKRRFSFKKLENEIEWLEERSKGNMLLCGRCGKEYVFEKVKRGKYIEYDIECVQDSEERQEFIQKMTSDGWKYIALEENGDKLYFARKKDGSERRQRRKLLTALWASMLLAVASVVTFISMGIYTAVTVYKNVISECDAMPQVYLFLIVTAACAGAFVSGVTAFKRISGANAVKEREGSDEMPEAVEAEVQSTKVAQSEELPHEETSNDDGNAPFGSENIVETDVVELSAQPDENSTAEVTEADGSVDESSEILLVNTEAETSVEQKECGENSTKQPDGRRLLLYWLVILLDLICFTQSVRFCYNFLWQDMHKYHALLIVAFMVIGFSPVILYSVIGALAESIRNKDKEQ